jgi:hypothetical protein
VADEHDTLEIVSADRREHVRRERARREIGDVAERALAVAAQVERDGGIACSLQLSDNG